MIFSIYLESPPLTFTSPGFATNPSIPQSFPPSPKINCSQRPKTWLKPGIIIWKEWICSIPYRVLKQHLPKPARSLSPNFSSSFMILLLFTELVQLQIHCYNVMPETRTQEFSWNGEEVGGGARPAPAAHQHSGRAAAPGGIPGIQLGWGKNNQRFVFLPWNFT